MMLESKSAIKPLETAVILDAYRISAGTSIWYQNKAAAPIRERPHLNSVWSKSHARGDVFPVDQVVQEVGQVFRARVTEVDVVGMFPHIAAQQRRLTKA